MMGGPGGSGRPGQNLLLAEQGSLGLRLGQGQDLCLPDQADTWSVSLVLFCFIKPGFIREDTETLRVWGSPKVTPRGGSGMRTPQCHRLDSPRSHTPDTAHSVTGPRAGIAIEGLQSTLFYMLPWVLLAEVSVDSAKRATLGLRSRLWVFGEEEGFGSPCQPCAGKTCTPRLSGMLFHQYLLCFRNS